ncbi:MAG: 8-oxo-dGTP diphosphatase [Clostridia bacterium]|nr:8-oxo-dGTP diphosphatase [Clostridia bacterium]
MAKWTLTNMVMITDPENGKVLIQNRVKKYPGYAFPGGHVDEGESIYDSAVREIKEETGYDVTELKSCGFIYWESLNGDRYFTYFFKTSSFSGECIGETEEGPVCWVDPAALSKMKLAPNMEKYMKMFSGSYSECYCLQDENGW